MIGRPGSGMYAYVTVFPESLYSSLTRVDFKIFFLDESLARLKIVFPASYPIINVRVSGSKETGAKYQMQVGEEGTTLTIKRSSENREASITVFIDKAVEDSGEIYFPLISARLNFCFRLEPCEDLMVRIIYPYPCHAYANLTTINVDNRTYVAGHIRRRESPYHLAYHDKGYERTQVSYACHDSFPKSSPAEIGIDSYYRPSFVQYLPTFLFPSIIGLPIVALWAIPDLTFMQRLLGTVSYIPVIFTVWDRSISIGKQRISSLINSLYLFWGVVCFFYIIAFQVLHVETTWIVFLPYFALILYALYILSLFGTSPVQISEPKIFWLHRLFAKTRHELEGWVTSRVLRKLRKQ